jgi:hypothetical protein
VSVTLATASAAASTKSADTQKNSYTACGASSLTGSIANTDGFRNTTILATRVESHPPGVYEEVVCVEVNNVDEECMNAFLDAELGSDKGMWSPWNSCQTWVWDALNKCPYIPYSSGGGAEGAPGFGGSGGVSGL